MSDVRQNFYSRVGRLNYKRARLGKNPSYQVTRDGLIIVQPEAPKGRRVTLRGIFLLAVALLAFKTLVVAFHGTSVYEKRIEALSSGTVIEQAGAFVMQLDPLTQTLADKVRPYLPQ